MFARVSGASVSSEVNFGRRFPHFRVIFSSQLGILKSLYIFILLNISTLRLKNPYKSWIPLHQIDFLGVSSHYYHRIVWVVWEIILLTKG